MFSSPPLPKAADVFTKDGFMLNRNLVSFW